MESYDFFGKTIVPFCTSGGSGIGSSASNLEELANGATWLDGQRLNGSYKDSIGRSYYGMFMAVRALLAKDGIDYSKHAGVISYFQKEYIKTGQFDN